MNDSGIFAITQLALGALAISLLLAQLRCNLEQLVTTICNSVIAVVQVVENSIGRMLAAFRSTVTSLSEALRESVVLAPVPDQDELPAEGADEPFRPRRRRPAIVDASGPLFYGAAALLLIAGDLYLAALRAGPLFGFEVSESLLRPGDARIDMLAGVLYVVTTIVFAAVLFETIGVGPQHAPFGTATGGGRMLILTISGVGTALSVVVAAILFVWAQSAANGAPDDVLATYFFALFAPLLVMATALAFVGSRESLVAVRFLVALLLSWVASALHVVTGVSIMALGVPRDITVSAVRLGATPGQTVWDWVARTGLGHKAQLRELPAIPPVNIEVLAGLRPSPEPIIEPTAA